MILGLRNKRPFISFGLGKRSISVKGAGSVTVYLNTIYNNEYTFTVYCSLPVTAISDYRYEIETDVPGEYEIYLKVISGKGTKAFSNKIILTVE